MKKKVAILFGGRSGEHEVSILSAISVYKALNKSKFDVTLVGIDKAGRWLMPDETRVLAHQENPRLLKLNQEKESFSLVPFESKSQIVAVQTSGTGPLVLTPQAGFDVIVPILHGTYGEDGTIQGLLELSNIPYVGSGVLGSALGMDKDVCKRLLKAEDIPVVPWLSVRREDFDQNPNGIIEKAVKDLGLPFFVKPANMGSSVGVHKIKNIGEANSQILDSFKYDNKILIEKAVEARELECSVLGNHNPKASIVGEVIPQHEFYSYEAKYIDENGAQLEIPAKDLSAQHIEQIQNYSVRAFKALECSGMARVDFFLDKKSGQLYLNEINTIPGFTKISMYPKLWEASGKPYSVLLEELIELAFERHQMKNRLLTNFDFEDPQGSSK